MAALFTMTSYYKFGGRGDNTIILTQNAIGASIVTGYMIFAIFSCAYSYRMTTRPGMSSQTRKDFISGRI